MIELDPHTEPLDLGITLELGPASRILEVRGQYPTDPVTRYQARTLRLSANGTEEAALVEELRSRVAALVEELRSRVATLLNASAIRGYRMPWRKPPQLMRGWPTGRKPGVPRPADWEPPKSTAKVLVARCRVFVDVRLDPLPVVVQPEGSETPRYDAAPGTIRGTVH